MPSMHEAPSLFPKSEQIQSSDRVFRIMVIFNLHNKFEATLKDMWSYLKKGKKNLNKKIAKQISQQGQEDTQLFLSPSPSLLKIILKQSFLFHSIHIFIDFTIDKNSKICVDGVYMQPHSFFFQPYPKHKKVHSFLKVVLTQNSSN